MVTHKDAEHKSPPNIRHRGITPDNAFPLYGYTWRLLRDQATLMGAKIYKLGKGGRRWMIDADDFHAKLEALAATPAKPANEAPAETLDPTAIILKQLGLAVRP